MCLTRSSISIGGFRRRGRRPVMFLARSWLAMYLCASSLILSSWPFHWRDEQPEGERRQALHRSWGRSVLAFTKAGKCFTGRRFLQTDGITLIAANLRSAHPVAISCTFPPFHDGSACKSSISSYEALNDIRFTLPEYLLLSWIFVKRICGRPKRRAYI